MPYQVLLSGLIQQNSTIPSSICIENMYLSILALTRFSYFWLAPLLLLFFLFISCMIHACIQTCIRMMVYYS
ncbi:unnamed protein product [Brugia timori]|uniref:Uncharacterized protein n=1 Tax=Brugia timori TaxID=42155 RepID=A0A3P7VUY9_9BILA|nr:unnamed protein product [Brugia timori]